MRILLTAGPTREPIDAVRYIGNRSSGQMGAAIASNAIDEGHEVTLVCGPVSVEMPGVKKRIDVETTEEMRRAVIAEFPQNELLIMAAAVSDYTPVAILSAKLSRHDTFALELKATPDILLEVSDLKRPNQRTVGFSLEMAGNLHRSRGKLIRKKLDLIVYNPTETMNSASVNAVLLWPDGREERPDEMSKSDFAKLLLARSVELFTTEARRHGGAPG
ncbi:MAG: phosphopantothenoylcysteine decarboxylase [Planctomycetales bacterium]|nr:phosphopantothenoylcysteine decarboxylase [Planctomycetales bacterium]